MTEVPPLSPAETRRRLPALELIGSDHIREATCEISSFAPQYFWTRAGSTSGYHNAHQHGLWAHTLKLSTVIERLADSYTERNLIREEDIDRVHAAAILHDQRKAGMDGDETRRDHDLRMGQLVADEMGDTIVARLVEEHMGPWYQGPPPQSPRAELLHQADMVASDDNCDIDLPGPVPDELQAHGYQEAEL